MPLTGSSSAAWSGPRPNAVAPTTEEPHVPQWFRRYGDLAMAVFLSVLLHLSILLVLETWRLLHQPQPAGFVINSVMQTEDLGAESPDNAIVHSVEQSDGDDQNEGDRIAWNDDPRSLLGDSDDASGGIMTGDQAPGPFGRHGRGARSGGIGFFGTRGQGHSFVFIVDCSGSMQGDRFNRAVDELARALLELDRRQRFFVIFYNKTAHPLFGGATSPRLIPATQKMRDRAEKWIRSWSASGDTQPAEAFSIALAMKPNVIFFLTDGEIPDDSHRVVSRENRHGTVIHTTGFQSREGEQMLKTIARDSGGTYRYVE